MSGRKITGRKMIAGLGATGLAALLMVWLTGSADSVAKEAVFVPVGTRISVRLDHAISSESNLAGDTFSALLDRQLVLKGKPVAPVGSRFTGLLTEVVRTGEGEPAMMTMILRKLVVGEEEFTFSTHPLTFSAGAAVVEDRPETERNPETESRIFHSTDPVAFGPESRFTFSIAEAIDLPVYEK